MTKFLQILRNIALSVALIGVIGVAIFRMNDIGTDAPVAICGAVALAGAVLGVLFALAERAVDKRK